MRTPIDDNERLLMHKHNHGGCVNLYEWVENIVDDFIEEKDIKSELHLMMFKEYSMMILMKYLFEQSLS